MSWGVKMRVCLGAFVSISDLVTDVYVVELYLSDDENRGYGWLLLAMIVASFIFQIIGRRRRSSVSARMRRVRSYRSEAVLSGKG